MSKNHISLISWTGVKSTLSLENFSQKIKYILDLSRSIKKTKKDKRFICKWQQSIMDWRISHGPSRLLKDNMKDLVSILQLIFFKIHLIFTLGHFLVAWDVWHSVMLYLVSLLTWLYYLLFLIFQVLHYPIEELLVSKTLFYQIFVKIISRNYTKT